MQQQRAASSRVPCAPHQTPATYVSKHHLPGQWRRLATSCANILTTRPSTGAPPHPPASQPACDHAGPTALKSPLRAGAGGITQHGAHRHSSSGESAVYRPALHRRQLWVSSVRGVREAGYRRRPRRCCCTHCG